MDKIDLFDKLKIEEARELYMKAISASDDQLKKLYLDKVILGTLYVVYNYIERNDLKILQCSQYNIEDIQSAFTEAWIKRIKNGELLKVDNYSFIFNAAFFNEVCKNLVGNDIEIYGQTGIQAEKMIDLFYAYVKLKNTGKDFNFDELMYQFYQENGQDFSTYPYTKKTDVIRLILDSMYNNLNFDKEEDLDITKHKLNMFIKLFINIGLYDQIPTDIASEDMLDDILNNEMYKNVIKEVDEELTDEIKRMIIHQRFGFDGNEPKKFGEIANQLGLSEPRIEQLEAQAFKHLRKLRKIRKYVK